MISFRLGVRKRLIYWLVFIFFFFCIFSLYYHSIPYEYSILSLQSGTIPTEQARTTLLEFGFGQAQLIGTFGSSRMTYISALSRIPNIRVQWILVVRPIDIDAR